MNTTKTTSNNRARWAAIGAAVAVSLGAGGLGIAQATVDSGPMNIYQAINPCRLSDTRPAPDLVGPRTTPLGANETYTFDGWGTVGNCTLPSNTAALELNVTAIGATAPTFLTLFPAGATMPTASNLNPVPSEPPTPNSVTVTLAADGKFSIFNAYGSVNFIIDVVGYYEDHMHTGDDIVDESLTGADIDNHSVSSLDTSNEAGVAWKFTERSTSALTGSEEVVASVPIRVPSNGYVNVSATLNWTNQDLPPGFDVAMCQITKGTTIDSAQPTFNLNDMDGGLTLAFASASAHNTFAVSVADNPLLITGGQSMNLVCDELVGNVHIHDVLMTAEFFPTEYNPGVFILPPVIIPFP